MVNTRFPESFNRRCDFLTCDTLVNLFKIVFLDNLSKAETLFSVSLNILLKYAAQLGTRAIWSLKFGLIVLN